MTDQEHLDHDQLVELKSTQSEPEANIIRSLLEGAGIDCTLVTQVPHGIYPFTVDGLAAIQIKVLDSNLEAARALLHDYENSADPGSDDGAPSE